MAIQLYHYGFERCEQGAFSHPLFQRDDETLSWSMGRKVKDDDEIHSNCVSTLTKNQAPPSPEKQNISATIIGQQHQQQQLMPRISLSNHDPLPQTFPNNYDPLPKSFNSVGDVVFSTQDAINMATELSVLLLEPRSIEQMRSDPLHIDKSFAALWPTEV
jgi:hypothetical protein